MGFLYLVGFMSQPCGHEDEFNHALSQLLDKHCSYFTPAGIDMMGSRPGTSYIKK